MPYPGRLERLADLLVLPLISVSPLEVGQHQDVKRFGAGSRSQGVEALTEPGARALLPLIYGWSALQLVLG